MNDLETRLHELGPTLDEAMGEAPAAWPGYSSASPRDRAVDGRGRRPWIAAAAAAVMVVGAVGISVDRLDRSGERAATAATVPSPVLPETMPLSSEGFPLVLPSDPDWKIADFQIVTATKPPYPTTDVAEWAELGFSSIGEPHIGFGVAPLDSAAAENRRTVIEEFAGQQFDERQVLGFPARVYTVDWWDPEDVPEGEIDHEGQHAILTVGMHQLVIRGFMPAADFHALLDTLRFVEEDAWREQLEFPEGGWGDFEEGARNAMLRHEPTP